MAAPGARRQGSSTARLLLILTAVLLGILFLFALLNAMKGPDDVPPPVVETTTTTATTDPVTTLTTRPAPPTTAPPTTVPPTTVPPTTSPTVPPTTPPPQDGMFVNDDYQVPDPDPNPPALPEPTTSDELMAFLTDNPLYAQTAAAPVRCDIDQIDLTTATKSQLKKHFDQLTACLMRVWGPTLDAAGFQAVRPTVTIYSGQIQSACGKMPDQNALYCSADQQVYYASNLPDIIPPTLRSARFVVDSVVAHEFGHAVQARTGILLSETYYEQSATQQNREDLANDASRRTEMQADCFAGSFLRAIAQATGLAASDEKSIGKLFFSIGDDQLTGDPTIDGNHGWGANRQTWLQAGLTNAALSSCNTFVADDNSVR